MKGMKRATKVETWIAEQLKEGKDPNEIARIFSGALGAVASDWVEWRDGHWRLDTVCPECGNGFAGVCGHKLTPVLRSEWKAKHGEAAG